MTSKIDFSQPLQQRIQDELGNMKGYKWSIDREDLGDCLIQIELDKAAAKIYYQFAQTLDPQTQEVYLKHIEKFEKKIESAQKITNYLLSNSPEIDPRVSIISSKISSLNLMDPYSYKKTIKYTKRLCELQSIKPNTATKNEILSVQTHLNRFRTEHLNFTPEFHILQASEYDLLTIYPKNANPLICLQAGKEQTSIKFLSHMLLPKGINKIAYCNVDFINHIVCKGHEKASKNLDSATEPSCPSLNHIFTSRDHNFSRVELGQDNEILPKKPQFNRIKDSLAAILFAKNEHNLTNISAIIRFGERHLIVSMDQDSIIYFFNPYGEKERSNNCPYVAAYKDLDQASIFLSEVLAIQIQEHPFNGAINISAICDTTEFLDNACKKYFSKDSSLPDDPSSDETHIPFSLPTMENVAPPIFHLQKAIDQLSVCTEEGFFLALDAISKIDQFKFCSPINGDQDKAILDRIFFQLYHIHNKETPSKIDRTDTSWGTNAFQSDELSTPEEKLRAAQRVQVETLMFVLDHMLKSPKQNDPEAVAIMALYFGSLESLNLHPNDLPKGHKNLAHQLFGTVYNNYLAAWEKNKTMTHPHDKCFKNDFGRNAFIGEAQNLIPVEFKIQALQEVIRSLKDAWKI